MPRGQRSFGRNPVSRGNKKGLAELGQFPCDQSLGGGIGAATLARTAADCEEALIGSIADELTLGLLQTLPGLLQALFKKIARFNRCPEPTGEALLHIGIGPGIRDLGRELRHGTIEADINQQAVSDRGNLDIGEQDGNDARLNILDRSGIEIEACLELVVVGEVQVTRNPGRERIGFKQLILRRQIRPVRHQGLALDALNVGNVLLYRTDFDPRSCPVLRGCQQRRDQSACQGNGQNAADKNFIIANDIDIFFKLIETELPLIIVFIEVFSAVIIAIRARKICSSVVHCHHLKRRSSRISGLVIKDTYWETCETLRNWVDSPITIISCGKISGSG